MTRRTSRWIMTTALLGILIVIAVITLLQ